MENNVLGRGTCNKILILVGILISIAQPCLFLSSIIPGPIYPAHPDKPDFPCLQTCPTGHAQTLHWDGAKSEFLLMDVPLSP